MHNEELTFNPGKTLNLQPDIHTNRGKSRMKPNSIDIRGKSSYPDESRHLISGRPEKVNSPGKTFKIVMHGPNFTGPTLQAQLYRPITGPTHMHENDWSQQKQTESTSGSCCCNCDWSAKPLGFPVPGEMLGIMCTLASEHVHTKRLPL